jgi:hypothetical protein
MKRRLEQRILEEISSCTYRDVGDFFAKYFEQKAWVKQARTIVEAARVKQVKQVNGRWLGYPQPPKQEWVLEWFFYLQRDFFANQRGFFYTTHNRALPGSEAKRQLDLFCQA